MFYFLAFNFGSVISGNDISVYPVTSIVISVYPVTSIVLCVGTFQKFSRAHSG